MTDDSVCPDHHRVLRLSLTKQKQRKIFLKCKKEIEKDIGSSKRSWFEDLTMCILPGKKCKRDVLTSPTSQGDLTFSMTPDLIKQHYELTPGSSAPLSVGHIMDSQGATPSPLRGWSPPFLGLSPVNSSQEGGDHHYQDVQGSHQANMITSLGINPNDSGMSWSSSLATPSRLSLNDSVSSCEEDSKSSKTHVKGLPRVLFSPGPTVTEERDNDGMMDNSGHELCDYHMSQDTERDGLIMSPSSGSKEQDGEVNKLPQNKVIKQEYIENYNIDSMPLFSQDLLPSQSMNLSKLGNTDMENDQIVKMSEPENDQIVQMSEPTVVTDLKEEIKGEVVSDTLSDFFDPPSKSVGRRRCAPSRGKKRKSEELSWNDSVDKLCSTPKEAVTVKSILSSEKRKNSQERMRKRVRFSEDSDDVKLFVRNSGTYDNKQDSSSKLVEIPTEDINSDPAVFIPDKSEGVMEGGDKHESVTEKYASSEENKFCTTTNDVLNESCNVSDIDEELFSQVSPSALNEMCSVAYTETESKLKGIPADVIAKDGNTIGAEQLKRGGPESAVPKVTSLNSPVVVKKENCSDLIEQTHEVKHDSYDIEESVHCEKKKDEIGIKENVSSNPMKRSLSLKQKPRKFFYPTKKQIKTSHPESVYEFPNKVMTAVPKQNVEDRVIPVLDDGILHSERIVTDVDRETCNGDGGSEMTEGDDVKGNTSKYSGKINSKTSTLGFQRFSSIRDLEKETDVYNDLSQKKKKVETLNHSDSKPVPIVSVNQYLCENISHSKPALSRNAEEKSEVLANSVSNDRNQNTETVCQGSIHTDCEDIVVLSTKIDRKTSMDGMKRETGNREDPVCNVNNGEGNIHNNNVETFGSFISTKTSSDVFNPEMTSMIKSMDSTPNKLISAGFQSVKVSYKPLGQQNILKQKLDSSLSNLRKRILSGRSDKVKCVNSKSQRSGKDLFADIFEELGDIDEKLPDQKLTRGFTSANRENFKSENSYDESKDVGKVLSKPGGGKMSTNLFTDIFDEYGDLTMKSGENQPKDGFLSFKTASGKDFKKSSSLLSDSHNGKDTNILKECHQMDNLKMDDKIKTLQEVKQASFSIKTRSVIREKPPSGGKAAKLFADIFEEYGDDKVLMPEMKEEFTGFKSAAGKDISADFHRVMKKEQRSSENENRQSDISKVSLGHRMSIKTSLAQPKGTDLFSDIFEELGHPGTSTSEQSGNGNLFVGFQSASGKEISADFCTVLQNELRRDEKENKNSDILKVSKVSPGQSKSKKISLAQPKGADLFSDIFEELGHPGTNTNVAEQNGNGTSFVGFQSAGGKEISSDFHTVIKNKHNIVDKKIEPSDFSTSAGRALSMKSSSGPPKGAGIFSDIFEELGCPGIDQSGSHRNEGSFVGFKSATGEQLKIGYMGVKNQEANSDMSVKDTCPSTSIGNGFKRPALIKNMTNVKSSRQQEMKSATLAAKFPAGSNIPKGFRPFKPPKILKAKALCNTKPDNTVKGRPESLEVSKDIMKSDSLPSEEKIDTLLMEEMFVDELEPSQRFSPDSDRPAKKARYETGKEQIIEVLEEIKKENETCLESESVSKKVHKKIVNEPSSTKSAISNSVTMETSVSSISDQVKTKDTRKPAMCDTVLSAAQRKESSDSDFGEEFYNVREIEMLEKHYIDSGRDNSQTVSENSKVYQTCYDTVKVEEKSLESRDEETTDDKDVSINDNTEGHKQQVDQEQGGLTFGCGFTTASGNKVAGPSYKSLEAARRMMAVSDEDIHVLPIHEEADTVTEEDNTQKQVELLEELTKPFSQVMEEDMCEDNVNNEDGSTKHSQSEECVSKTSQCEDHNVPKIGENIETEVIHKDCGEMEEADCRSDSKITDTVTVNKLYNNDQSDKESFVCSDNVPGQDISSATMVKLSGETTTTNGGIINSPFQSASGKAIGISANSLRAAQDKMNDSDLPSHNLNLQNMSEKRSDVSAILSDPEQKSIESDKETIQCPFQSASGKMLTISADALQAARNTFNDDQHSVSLFSSASGDMIQESTDALLKARGTSTSDQELTMNSPFQSASGKKINISESALKAARQTLESDQELAMDSPFQSASGKKINISESALKTARQTLESDQEWARNSPFQSASGKKINISESALKAARQTLESDQEWVMNSPFQSASGNKINISERALKATRQTLESDQELAMNSPFQSASGKKINISESALKAARQTLESDQELAMRSPFQSVSGKKINISESALKAARQTLESDQELAMNSPFQSASGKKINISESALKAARQTLESDQELTMNSPFQSASGKKINISESALKAARQTLESDQKLAMNSPFQSAFGKKINISESALRAARQTLESDQELAMNSPFQSASGKKINISESALKAARQTLESDQELAMNSPFQSASGKKINISESALTAARQNLDSDQELARNSPFQSASGKKINISESALRAARQTLESDQELAMNSPFQSASAMEIDISESALKAARKTLESDQESTSPSFQTNQSMSSSNSMLAASKINNDKESVSSPFQSASGKTVCVKSDSLLAVRETMKSGEETTKSLLQDTTGTKRKELSDSVHPSNTELERNNKTCQLSSNTQSHVPFGSLQTRTALIANGHKEEAHEVNVTSKNCESAKFPYSTSRDVVTGVDRRREPPDLDDLVMAGDFDDEMESPLDSEIKYKDDRPGVKPFATDPEKFGLDRRMTSRPYTPLQCRILKYDIRGGSTGAPSRSLLEVSTGNPGNSSFKTPYKTMTSSVTSSVPNTTPQTTDVKPKTPVFGVKPGHVSVCKDESVSVCNTKDNSCNVLPVCHDKMYSNLESCTGDTAERRMINKNTSESHNEKIDVQALCEARKKQSDMIEARSKVKVKPVEGILYKMKSSNGRYKLRDLFDITRIGSKKLQKPSGLMSALGVTAGIAAKFTFRLADYYGVNLTHVYLGDGAFVVPDDRGNVGHPELYQELINLCVHQLSKFYSWQRGFLTVSGVDEKLISREWFINHYRWIVWKLAAYERMSNKCLDKWYLTPENVMLQMKYRYDREVDKCHRSAIKKVTERDDAPSKRMVLLVSGISNHGNNKTESTGSTSNLDSKVSIELSDGWYCIPTTLDVPLSHLIQKGRIREGHKLCISGAELTGSQDACSPLEIPAGLSLSICANSTRPVTWDSRLGYHTDPRPLCVPLCSLYGEGGNVGCVDVVLLRKYPIMYMEKLPDGGCVFRSAQAEEKYQQHCQRSQQEEMEKMYHNMEKMYEDGEDEENCITKKSWSKKEVEHLQSGHEIYEAYKTTKQPDILEGYLSEEQIRMMMDYRRQLQDERRQKLQNEFTKAWADNDKNVKRNVVPLLKLRVHGCSRRDLDTKISMLITVWRPDQGMEHLKEGTRYRVYGLTASTARSRYTESPVQLTLARHGRFKALSLDENSLDMVYEPRRPLCVADLRSGTAPYGEADIIGMVINVDHTQFTESGKIQDIVYCVDCNRDVFGVKFWGGNKAVMSGDNLARGRILCFSNLIDRPSYRSSILPVLEWSSELSLCTQTPQGVGQRGVVTEIQGMMKAAGGCGTFLEECRRILEELLQRKEEAKQPAVTPQRENLLAVPESTTPVFDGTSEKMRKHKLAYHSKMSHLMVYSTPTSLSPITSPLPKSVRKEFVPPKLCRQNLL